MRILWTGNGKDGNYLALLLVLLGADNTRTNKVTEYVYQRHGDAVKRIDKLMDDLDNVITICDSDEIHLISARAFDELLGDYFEESDED